jgi:acyl carrier protein
VTREQVLSRVSTIVADTLGHETLVLQPESQAADVDGWDSLAHVQIIVAVERAFGIRFRTGEIATIKNVGELVDRIVARTGGEG